MWGKVYFTHKKAGVVMTSSTDPVDGTSSTPVTDTTAPATTDVPSGTQPHGKFISTNMSKLKTEAPELYKSMTMAIAQTYIAQSNKFQKHLKKIYKEEAARRR